MSPIKPEAEGGRRDSTEQQGKSYWRSLERLYDSPALQERLADEFPEGAAESPDGISRRTMLSIMGASFAMAGAVSCRRPEQYIVPYAEAPEGRLPGVPKQYATTATLGTDAWGLVVESHDGRPSKIEGNSLHPASRGGAGPWLQASVLGLFDPDRSRSPMHRAEGGVASAAWEDFQAAWQGALEAAPDGTGVAVLAEGSCSPTLARQAEAFRQKFPGSRWLTYEPASDSNVLAGTEAVTGSPLRPVYHLEKADVVVALESDFLAREGSAEAHARGFSQRRRVQSEADDMNRLFAVESTLTSTGSMADHRIRMRSSDIPAFAAALAAELGVAGASTGDTLDSETAEKLSVIAQELRAAGPRGLVVAGRGLPPEVHGVVLGILEALGAIGSTVTLHGAEDISRNSSPEELAALEGAMESGEVTTLLMLGGNPAYSLPGELGFAEALAKVPTSIYLGPNFDETAELSTWHLPQAHFLESWGDARAADGTWSLTQPLIEPLFGARSTVEVLAMVLSEEASGYDIVRATAQERWGTGSADDGGFENRWRRALHDGLVPESASDPVSPAVDAAAAGAALAGRVSQAAGGLEITFPLCPAVHDGRFANNGWLQELPDPITKITWDNAALISPKTAADLGIETDDVLRLSCGGRTLEAAAWILPGQADDSIALTLGYGRTGAGRVGSGVGSNAYVLRENSALQSQGGLEVSKAGRRHDLVQTQEHWSLEVPFVPEDRPLVREATLAEYRAHPDFATKVDDKLKLGSMWEDFEYTEGNQWGMAIDLNVCTGCNACVVACQSENNIPIVGRDQVQKGREMHWLRVDRYFSGDESDPEVVFQPIPCMHCENAPCEQVCPVAATVHDREGINAMVYNRCIGTRYCSNNCPYKVRRFNFFNFTKDTPELAKMAMNPDVTVRSRGVMEKCSYCIQRINQGKIVAKRENRELVDGDVKTACQQTCAADAISFGNILDPESQVSRRKGENRNYVMLAELNNKPRTSYLAKLRNPSPDWPGAEPPSPPRSGHGADHGTAEG